MHARSAIRWGIAFAVLALAAGPAGAQTNPAQTSPADQGQPGQPGQPPSSTVTVTPPSQTAQGQVGFQRKTNLTFPEMLTEGDAIIKKVGDLKGEVKKTLE